MSEPFIGEIRLFPYTFAPRGWAFCRGQILPISQNTALFALLGVMYGGNGQTTFALPNLQGRMAVSAGAGPGGTYNPGDQGGAPTHTLIAPEMPAHNHLPSATDGDQTTSRPSGAVPAAGGEYASAGTTSMAGTTVAGGSQAHNNMPPYLTLNYCIALEGIFPSRN